MCSLESKRFYFPLVCFQILLNCFFQIENGFSYRCSRSSCSCPSCSCCQAKDGQGVSYRPYLTEIKIRFSVKLMPSVPQLITHHAVSPPVSVPCHNGFNWDVAAQNTSVPNVAPPSPLTTHQLNSQTSPTTTLSSPKPLERTQVFGPNTRTRRPPSVLPSVTASRLVSTTRVSSQIWGHQRSNNTFQVTQWSRPSVPSLVTKNLTLFSTSSSIQSSLTDTTVTPPMPVTQLIWMFASSLPPQSIQLASTSLPPDAELDVPSVEPDSHHALPSKKDVKSKELLSRVFSTWPVTSLVLTSHWLDPAHTLLCQVSNWYDVIIIT